MARLPLPDGDFNQDTFVDILNDYPDDVRVQMYFVNGDEELDAVEIGDPAVLIERAHPHDPDEGDPLSARLGEPTADAQSLLADDALHPHLTHERPDLVVHEDVPPDQAVGRRRRRGGDDEVGGVHDDGRRGENREDGARTRGQRPCDLVGGAGALGTRRFGGTDTAVCTGSAARQPPAHPDGDGRADEDADDEVDAHESQRTQRTGGSGPGIRRSDVPHQLFT